jgi:hypothetical protein
MSAPSEIDGYALLFPIAVASRVEAFGFALWGLGGLQSLRFRLRRGLAEIFGRVEMSRAFHHHEMVVAGADAKS